MFKPNTLFYSDGYKVGHKKMMAPGTDYLYGTWIPRGLKHAHKSIKKIVSAGQALTWRWLHDEFEENFFKAPLADAVKFGRDMSQYLGQEFDSSHFEELHALGYLPIRVKSLPEGIETLPNIPHQTFINTKSGFAWLTLYLETIVSSLSWKTSTNATIALQYRRNAYRWIMKTDPAQLFLLDYMCHDFSSRGLDPFSMLSSGLGHAMSHRGSDSLIVIPGARYFYKVPEDQVCINSVNASEHSVSTTKIFTVGEKQMILDWCKEFPTGILSIVADTFDLWKLVTEYLADPEVREAIMSRDGKLVVRPDSGDPVDIICGTFKPHHGDYNERSLPEHKGVIELLWDIFGGTINEQGYKVLDSHIGAIYGDSINLERQIQMYERLETKGFASTNIVLGVGSFTYQFNTRDTFGYAAKGAWFENNGKGINIYKDPITDDGTKKSLKGRCSVHSTVDIQGNFLEYEVKTECSEEEEKQGLLHVIYEDGKFSNMPGLEEIRGRMQKQ
jgi:nicotinamide phosphoribosyltransferase|tara:strand:+ start:6475 stop:7977 length:1503 start_codon:yes stop_codon:yes gene_type:complete